MAIGDTQTYFSGDGAGVSNTFQPTSGTTYCLLSVGGADSSGKPNVSIALTDDGSNVSTVMGSADANGTKKVFFDNTNYLHITNNDASAAFIGWIAVQVL